jgi:peptide/nickel transport system substrate-binding protein
MRRLLKVLLLGAILALVVAPVAAQDDSGDNVIVDSTFGSGPIDFNPVTSSDATAFQIMSMLYPSLVGVNPETALIEPGAPGGASESWDVSDDGLVYTFHLRDDLTWTDGEPLVAQDFQATWDAIASGEVDTPLVFLQDTVSGMEALDDHTLQVTFKTNTCEALNNAGVQPIPSHIYTGDDWAALADQPFTEPGTLSVGPYQVSAQIPDQQTALTPVEAEWPDGATNNNGYILKVVGDQTVQVEQFLAGETDVINGTPVNRRSDVRAAAEAADSDINVFDYSPGNSYDYVGLNLANPDNPQEAYDESGNLVEQDPNPYFSDIRVRQALAMALNVDEIIQGAVFGEGTRMASSYAQGTWPYNADVPNYEFDPEAAGQLLDEAGWVDNDNDPSTPRVAQGVPNVNDGDPFEFTLLTNEGNTRREAVGTIVQDQLAQIGIKVDFQTVDFNVLLDIIDNQTYDAFILGWQNTYPFTADQLQLFGTHSDTIGGSNSGSYINPELDDLFQQALAVPGCDPAERAKIYGQIQEILNRDLPYLFLYSQNGIYAWHDNVEGVEPFPANLYWNVNEWAVTR